MLGAKEVHVGQFASVFSNLVYLAVGLVFIFYISVSFSYVAGAMMLLLFVGSSLYHVYAEENVPNSADSVREADIIGIMAVLAPMAAWGIFTTVSAFTSVPEEPFVVAGFLAWIVAGILLRYVESFVLIGVFVVPMFAGVFVAEPVLGFATVACFGAAIGLWAMDRNPSSMPHALWHLMTGIGFYVAGHAMAVALAA